MSQRGHRLISFLMGLSVVAAAGQAAVVHVDVQAPAGGDGSTWSKAYSDLQDGLDAARAGGIDEIRVARGTYTPARGGLDQNSSFSLVSGVRVVGGYLGGNGAAAGTRDPERYATVLSGDLLGNDGPAFSGREDNSRAVVTFTGVWGVDDAITLDGLTVRGGEGASGDLGAAMRLELANLHLIDCVIEDNRSVDGGAVKLQYCGPVRLDRVVVRENAGGGLDADGCWEGSALASRFEDNDRVAPGRSTRGGGAKFSNTRITLDGCTFRGNRADRGGGLAALTGDYTLIDSVVMDNEAMLRGGGVEIFGGLFAAIRCDFIGNSTEGAGGAVHTSSATADLVSSLLWANAAGTEGEGGAVYAGPSLTRVSVVNTSVLENSAGMGGAMTLDGPAELVHVAVWNNHAAMVGGVLERGGAGRSGALLVSSVVTENGDAGGVVYSAQVSSDRAVVAKRSFLTGLPGGTPGENSGADPELRVIPVGGRPQVVLTPTSACVDFALASDLPDDAFDLDGDGDEFEPLSRDGFGAVRVQGTAPDAGPMELRPGAEVAADINGDGVVSGADLAEILQAWGACPGAPAACLADLNQSGAVDGADLSVFLSYWRPSSAAAR